MGQITRCPSCGTMFKVVPDQLKISDGWVRCGHCAEVFDAQLNMQHGPPPMSARLEADVHVEASQARLSSLSEPGSEGLLGNSAVTDQDHTASTPASLNRLESGESVESASDSEPAEHYPSSGAEGVPLSEQATDVVTETQAVAPVSRVNAMAEPSDMAQVSFLRAAPSRAATVSPLVRMGMVVSSVMLCCTLAVQILLTHRNWLVATHSGMRGPLEMLCEIAGCALEPQRQIEALVIDGSSFDKLQTDVYRLSLTLRNISKLDVAMPAIELTLTDAQERVLIRRVLKPVEFNASSASVNAGSEWAGTIMVQVTAPAQPISGYRVLAFYP